MRVDGRWGLLRCRVGGVWRRIHNRTGSNCLFTLYLDEEFCYNVHIRYLSTIKGFSGGPVAGVKILAKDRPLTTGVRVFQGTNLLALGQELYSFKSLTRSRDADKPSVVIDICHACPELRLTVPTRTVESDAQWASKRGEFLLILPRFDWVGWWATRNIFPLLKPYRPRRRFTRT